ncbi:MAG: S8 family peptidase [Bacteroidaceae bacterium]|nr:S8 family peptidase [Bacteroidaceae bacterium]
MKKILLLAGALALSAVTMAQVAVQPKWDFTLERMMRGQQQTLLPATRGAGSGVTSVTIEVTDAAEVMTFIQNAGYKTTQITDNVVTAIIPISFVEQLATLESVRLMNGPVKMQSAMDKAREVAGVDDIHTNALNEFETPFTGKGVIVGVIDQGFQYRHAAFMDKDKNTRVISLWNRENYPRDGQPTTDIPDSGQADLAGGHGSHVTGIAAGSKVSGCDYYGVAHEADIIMIPSTFEDTEVLEDVAHIKNVAKTAGKPYVINMSFGGHMGPHDGTSLYNRTLSNLVADNSGTLVCAAGNEGNDLIHASHTFTEDDEVRYIFVDQSTASNPFCYLNIWEQTGDGNEYITVTPCYYKNSTKKVTTITNLTHDSSTMVDLGIDTYNKKQYCEVICMFEELKEEVGADDIYFGVKIVGKKGANIHIWNTPYCGDLYTPISVSPIGGVKKEQFLKGDYEYTVMDGGSAEKVVTVASYNSGRYKWMPLGSTTEVGYSAYKEAGAISSFSSRGPSLTENVIHPTIAAPGAVIISALNSYSSGFSSKGNDVCASVKLGSNPKQYYYGAQLGTSMSAPFVTGVIALWYQANPNLTHEQIMTILKETAINDEYTAEGGQNAWGYGKINAYEGLKRALKLASTDGINDMQNSEAPVSFQKGNNAWRILFNNNESVATIRVTDLNGRLVATQTIEQAKRGQEIIVSLETLPAGVYLINVATTKANITRKVMKN